VNHDHDTEHLVAELVRMPRLIGLERSRRAGVDPRCTDRPGVKLVRRGIGSDRNRGGAPDRRR
jgi:hypothetical protein